MMKVGRPRCGSDGGLTKGPTEMTLRELTRERTSDGHSVQRTLQRYGCPEIVDEAILTGIYLRRGLTSLYVNSPVFRLDAVSRALNSQTSKTSLAF